jgi:hypothetical protein
MGLLNKIFRPDRSGPDSQPPSGTRFQEGDDQDDEAAEREATRRELVQMCLRETMRRHAVPSDWISSRILPVVTSKRKSGMHVQLVVKQGQGNLLRYIPSFQSSLMAEIEKFEPRAWDWLLSISWQFDGITSTTGAELPGGDDWSMGAPAAVAAGAAAATAAAAANASAPAMPEGADEDVMEDLQALFAIRDAVLKGDAPAAGARPGEQPDFEDTHPGS